MHKMKFLLFFLGLLVISLAEKFVKVEETFGEFLDIIVNSKGRWYIVYNNQLFTSTDKGVTREHIDLPSKKTVLPILGIDEFDNVYVQDSELKVFRVIRSESGDFVFKEISLPHINEKLVSRPFSFENKVYFASKSGMMRVVKNDATAFEFNVAPYGNSKITQMIYVEYTTTYNYNKKAIFYSGGGNRQWIYRYFYSNEKPVWQTESLVKRMNAVNNNIYYVVNDLNEVNVIQDGDERIIPVKVKGIDAANINFENDFVIHSPKHDNKTYIYMNVNDKGIIYGLGEKNADGNLKVVSEHQLNDKVSLRCAVYDNDTIYFGTSDGVYKLTDISQNKEKPYIRLG